MKQYIWAVVGKRGRNGEKQRERSSIKATSSWKASFIFLKDCRLLLAKTHDLFTILIKEKKLLELPASSI